MVFFSGDSGVGGVGGGVECGGMGCGVNGFGVDVDGSVFGIFAEGIAGVRVCDVAQSTCYFFV